MATRIHRVVVRGQFADLTADQRTDLLAEVDDHSIFRSSFNEWGTFTYDERLVAFNFRYEVRSNDDAGDAADDAPDPVEVGLAKAQASLTEWGLGSKHLRATAADLTTMWADG